jgi:tricorn protease
LVGSVEHESPGQRNLSLPMPAKNYRDLAAGKTNTLFYLEGPPVDAPPEENDPVAFTLYRYDVSKRKSEKFVEDLKAADSSVTGDIAYYNPFVISENGEKLLHQKGARWFIVPSGAPPKAGDGAIRFENLEQWLDPQAMWRQMYHEAWRVERDFLYDPGLHGLDWKAAQARYEKYLPGLASRADLNYRFEEMLGELTLGHVFVFGGQMPEAKRIPCGLLGADYQIENGRYRFARIYNGENWNPQLHAPLTRFGRRRLLQFQPPLLRPGGQGRRGHR